MNEEAPDARSRNSSVDEPEERSGSLSLFKKILFSGIVFLVFLFSADLLLRATGYLNLTYLIRSHHLYWKTLSKAENRDLIWTYRKDQRISVTEEYVIDFNEFGLATKSFPESNTEEDLLVACFGDSVTFGVGRNNPYPVRLEQKLQKQYPGKDVHVFNMGVVAYNVVLSNELRTYVENELGYRFDVYTIFPVRNDNITYDRSLSSEEIMKREFGNRNTYFQKAVHTGYRMFPYLTGFLSHIHRGKNLIPKPPEEKNKYTGRNFFLEGRNKKALEVFVGNTSGKARIPPIIITWPENEHFRTFARRRNALYLPIQGEEGVRYRNGPSEGHGNARFHSMVADQLAEKIRRELQRQSHRENETR